MKSRIAELERENSFLRQQTRLPLTNQSTHPTHSGTPRYYDLSSLQSGQWDPDGELGSMILENNLLPEENENLSGPPSLDLAMDDLSRFQVPNNSGDGKGPGCRSVGGCGTPPVSQMRPKGRTGANLLHSTNHKPAMPGGATNALHLATISGNVKCVQILLEHGFNVDSVDVNGRTSLMLAASADNSDLIRTLLGRGADSSVCAPDGHTALETAAQLGNANALGALLLSAASEKGGVTMN